MAEMELAYKYDDMALYKAFVGKWADYPAVSTKVGKEKFPPVKRKLDSVASRENLPHKFRTQFIRTTNYYRYSNVKKMADLEDFWTIIILLVDAVEISSQRDTEDVSGIESAFEKLVKFMIPENIQPLPDRYFDLQPLFSAIVRPYYAVAMALVIECHTLHRSRLLDEAIHRTKDTLNAAAAAQVTYDPRAKWIDVLTDCLRAYGSIVSSIIIRWAKLITVDTE
ncbi:hypothetical protein R3P38DRAFT_3004350 [Favolaschia claudopus]|uniref:Uncharacterized protein n=1 Tax=Favolaschia claudopus TaxID=2862362 RepID=A0AAW0ALC6_9AGAR